ncbi:MAG TPA: hypothetical protein VGN64_00465 [Dyadobacter sp.]|nr:hypothetical protein [Dyadobacter sp.]
MRFLSPLRVVTFLILSTGYCLAQSGNPISIPGTKYSLTPPTGFEIAKQFSGFHNAGTGASIMLNELPAPLDVVQKGFDADALKSKGMTLLDDQTINFNGNKARILKISQFANGALYSKETLIFGDSTKTVLVNGVYLEKNKDSEAEIRKAVLSTRYDANRTINPFDAVNFTVDAGGTGYKFATTLSGSLIYTPSGKISPDKPLFIAGNSISKVAVTDRREFSLNRFKKLPNTQSIHIKEINPITIDGLEGYEITAADTSGKENIYQMVLFSETNDYYILAGNTKESSPESLEAFRKIALTFKRK